MGQKIHPLGLRLGISQSHWSNWFAQPHQYSEFLQEDEKMRSCIKEYVRKYVRTVSSYGGIARIEIQRKTDEIKVEIYTGFPDLFVERLGPRLKELRRDIQDKLTISKNLKFIMALAEVEKPYAQAAILGEYIALQLESRVAFRKTMKRAIQLAKEKGNVKGIKIQIAGRLNGAEIARSEWAREGRVPLQTLRAQIDYCHYPAQTIYGVLGIKVWIFQDE
uniref:Small ribosomal subunit protein uS3c n=2 Tax=Roya TaxID=43942 RepID=A0A024B4I0_9VIRI|nr:ribosomal protein S3 [Roya anglica]YP_009256890.1 ribosomal protein S3 [Roya obtusa]AHZ11111.1 ribosomal protein S3 [Roya anglica]ANI25985.1 ribosomal protein S3 [Roya obtusa]